MRNSQPPRSSIRWQRWGVAFSVIVVASVAACDCQQTPTSIHPDLIANPRALSFDACPVQDENNHPVHGVAPGRQVLRVQNIGRSAATLSYELRGSGASRFEIDPGTWVESLGPGSSADVAVLFTPIRRGDSTAELAIDDGSDATDPLVIALNGTGIALPPQPTVELLYEHRDTGAYMKCEPSITGEIDNCLMEWPATFYDESRTMKVKLKNVGCGPLHVTELSLEPYEGTGQLQYFLDVPQLLPSAVSPVTLSSGGADAAEMELAIRFAPALDESSAGSDARFGVLTVRTNAANSPVSKVLLRGEASAPSCYVTPSHCDFTSPQDECGGFKVPGNPTVASFRVSNGGNENVQVESITFRNPSNGRFAFGLRVPVGETIAPAQFTWLDVAYTDAPLYLTEILEIQCRAGTSNAGRPNLSVAGGVLPCLSTKPDLQLDFTGAATQVSTRPVQICNGTGCGVLDIERVEVQNFGGNFFTIVPGTNPEGQHVQPGACASVEIQLSRPISGGLQTSTLEIQTNDPNFAAPSYKRINLLSDAPLDQIPVASVKGPAGQTNAFSVSLADLAALNPKRITLHGEQSYDPPNNEPATKFQWFLEKPVLAAATLTETSTAGAQPDVHGSILDGGAGGDQINLNLDPFLVGEYKVALRVYDGVGQASGNLAEIRIIVNP